MSKFKHTPGPWRILEKSASIQDSKGDSIVSWVGIATSNFELKSEEYKANAKLIAAAPELLEALEVCYKSLCTYGRHPIIDKQVENVFRKLQ